MKFISKMTENIHFNLFKKINSSILKSGQKFIGDRYLTCNDIDFVRDFIAFSRQFKIFGVNLFTKNCLLFIFLKHFPLWEIEKPAPRPNFLV